MKSSRSRKSLTQGRPLSRRQKEFLRSVAEEARQNSHSPYSKFQVGAALLYGEEDVFTGVNIENASFGGTVCAERVALWKAVSEGYKESPRALFVSTSSPQAWPPCGICRQTLAEFCTGDTLIFYFGTRGGIKKSRFKDLLPEAFSPQDLRRTPNQQGSRI